MERHKKKVGLVKGDASYSATMKALELIRDEVHVPSDMPILIKPNMVFRSRELAATPVDAVRATMDFLKTKGIEKFIVGEGTSGPEGDTMGAFEDYGYFSLKDDFDVEFRNLNEDEWIPFEILDLNLNPTTIRLAKTYFHSYVVSVTRMKTHLVTVLTLAIKNIAISCINNDDRNAPSWQKIKPNSFSHNPQPIHLNIARIIRAVQPGLAVIDGVVGMEGRGPGEGTPINSGIALASTDFLAIDVVGSEMMGTDPRIVGYLWYLMQLEGFRRDEVQVVGEDPRTCVTRYEMYEKLPAILGWWIENWQEYLEGTFLKGSLHQTG
jgi:uncharacterized protein (DUF362 family)